MLWWFYPVFCCGSHPSSALITVVIVTLLPYPLLCLLFVISGSYVEVAPAFTRASNEVDNLCCHGAWWKLWASVPIRMTTAAMVSLPHHAMPLFSLSLSLSYEKATSSVPTLAWTASWHCVHVWSCHAHSFISHTILSTGPSFLSFHLSIPPSFSAFPSFTHYPLSSSLKFPSSQPLISYPKDRSSFLSIITTILSHSLCPRSNTFYSWA